MKLSQFLQLKEGTSRERGLIRWVIFILLAGLLLEGYFLVQARFQERILLVPLLGKPAAVGWDSASPEYLDQLSRHLLPLVTTYHPRSLDGQIAEFLKYVSPESFALFKAQLLSQAEEAKKTELSQVFFPMESSVEKSSARVTGLLRRFIGKTLTSEEVIDYEVCYAIRHGRAFVVGLERSNRIGRPDRGGERPCDSQSERERPQPD